MKYIPSLILVCLLGGCVSRAKYLAMANARNDWRRWYIETNKAWSRRVLDAEDRLEALESFVADAKSREARSIRYYFPGGGSGDTSPNFYIEPPFTISTGPYEYLHEPLEAGCTVMHYGR